MSRWITYNKLYYQGQKFKWFNQLLPMAKNEMFEDIGAIAELELNEIIFHMAIYIVSVCLLAFFLVKPELRIS